MSEVVEGGSPPPPPLLNSFMKQIYQNYPDSPDSKVSFRTGEAENILCIIED
jgi:hypothetical protein